MGKIRKIEELEAELARLRREQDDETRARRDAVTAIYQHTLSPTERTHEQLADPSCRWYRLEGQVLNRGELEAVGKSTQQLEGGIDYLFNSLSGRFVLMAGGGTIYLYLTDRFGHTADTEAFAELEALVQGDPERTHDVSGTVERARAKRGKQVL